MLPQAKLVALQKLLVRNSMMTAKAKMMGDKPFKLVIDWTNSIDLLPALDIK
jgi:hypothetical protein